MQTPIITATISTVFESSPRSRTLQLRASMPIVASKPIVFRTQRSGVRLKHTERSRRYYEATAGVSEAVRRMTNPYAPPQSTVTDVVDPFAGFVLADRGTRLGAVILDTLIGAAMTWVPFLAGTLL